jgi:hypothetical protein
LAVILKKMLVILNAVKDLAFFMLRLFAKEAQNYRIQLRMTGCRSVPQRVSHPELAKDLKFSA